MALIALSFVACGDETGAEDAAATSTGDAPPCATCKEVSEAKGAVNNVCSGAAESALGPLVVCMCDTCADDCLDNTCQGGPAPEICLSCLMASCNAEFAECQAN